ncbi:MAG: glycosyltransferase family 1 protein [Spirochaetaceae bacterium]|nr:MAG: glycosyltransferase family 1 protein [Spirochaetaceae bacterium]
MNVIRYTVNPRLPRSLQPLSELAHNLWVSWNYDAVALFTRLDYDTWIESRQNPVQTLAMVSQGRLKQLASDDSYRAALESVYENFKKYRDGETWYKGSSKDAVAYFSMEYGLDVSLPIYSGGLGMLSGDHMKTASDLGLPLVGVGLLYRQGYFQQYLNADGFQQESYPENDWYNMPVRRCRDKKGQDVKITVRIGASQVIARIWQVKVGRIALYLLDTNIEDNSEEQRTITASLYGGTRDTRIRQEILLGIGGIRALRALGINPAVTHMNEGHSAFLGIERIRELVEHERLTVHQAIEALKPTNIFTTHTPVPAGNERFAVDLINTYADSLIAGTGLTREQFMALGRENPSDHLEHFCMTVLALKLSAYNNGVSRLHGQISRRMWNAIWPGLPQHEVPISSVTNGVHVRTHVAQDIIDLLDRYFGPRFAHEPTNLEMWNRMDRITDEELWRAHERCKSRLVVFARERLQAQLEHRGVIGNHLSQAREALSPTTLTISFARRFATYKRGALLFRDSERLMKLFLDPERPIQLIFAGKAHPHDLPGKNLIKEIVHFANQPEVRSKIVFLENYDISIARYLVSGSDLWLNTPRRPLEASGTSGMKAAINGVLNCSVLDGWWAEAYTPEIGWAIGNGEEYEDAEMQDEIESKALYDLLEREIVPTFYTRGQDGLPRDWIALMKASMREIGQRFSSYRMLVEYAENFYFPALENYARIADDHYARARQVSAFLEHVQHNWGSVHVREVARPDTAGLHVGDTMTVDATVKLGALKPEDVEVELYYGKMSSRTEIINPQRSPMEAIDHLDGVWNYRGRISCDTAGRQGYTVRVIPRHTHLVHPFQPGLIAWA